jgi:hypothetical protein
MLITLPSNSNMQLYPTNKATEYVVSLRKPIDLDGSGNDCEAALLSIQFAQGWNNVHHDTMLRLFVKPTMALPTPTVIAATGKTELFYLDAPGMDGGRFRLCRFHVSVVL